MDVLNAHPNSMDRTLYRCSDIVANQSDFGVDGKLYTFQFCKVEAAFLNFNLAFILPVFVNYNEKNSV